MCIRDRGSILGTFLFCITTDRLEQGLCHKSPVPREVDIDPGLARIVTDQHSELGLNNITAVADEEELCVPFERNGVSSTPTARGQFVPFKPGGNLHMDLQRPYESSDEDDLPPRRVPNARRRIQDTPDPECSPDLQQDTALDNDCLLYTSPSPRD